MNNSIKVKQQQMPAVGFGLWKIARDDTADMVFNAIKAGYRHLDSAADYGNEKQAGEGIRRALAQGLCTRQDLWITSKLWNTFHHPQHVREACEKSLSDLSGFLIPRLSTPRW
jgi:D-xylose reductase